MIVPMAPRAIRLITTELLLLLLFFLIFYVLLSPLVNASPNIGNVLSNGSFEKEYANWQHSSANLIELKTVTDPELVYIGNQSLYIKATNNLGISQTATIDPTKHFFANANVLVTKGRVKLVVSDNQSAQVFSAISREDEPNWQRLAINLPPHTTSDSVNLQILADGSAEWYVDNIILHEVDLTPSPINDTFQETFNPTFYWKGEKIEQQAQFPLELQSLLLITGPLPETAKSYQTKVLIAAQVDPEFATPANIIDKINQRLASFLINKTLIGEVEVFDQSIPTNCTVGYYEGPFNIPDEYCLFNSQQTILIGVIHGAYDGLASYSGKLWATDQAGWTRDRDFVLLHELGHVLGFAKHYDDAWSIWDRDQLKYLYQSPFIGDIMGHPNYPIAFLEHSRGVLNRSTYLLGTNPNITTRNLPDTIQLVAANNQPFSGRLTIYPAIYQGQHRGSTIDPAVTIGPISVAGNLDYKTIGKPFIGKIVAENASGVTTEWLDSSSLQTVFWRGSEPIIPISLPNDPNYPTPTPLPELQPSPIGKIVFYSFLPPNYNSDIYTINPDGSGLQNITSTYEESDYDPTFSLDGSEIASITSIPGGSALMITSLIEQPQEILFSYSGSYFYGLGYPLFSPNNNQLVFIASSSNSQSIYRYHRQVKTTYLIKEFPENTHITLTSISPDGNKLLYVKSTSNIVDIFTIGINGENEENLTESADAYEYDPIFSPDGGYIVFGAAGDLYKMNLSDQSTIQLTNTPNIFEQRPSFSPDGTKITFNANTDDSWHYDIHIVNSDGSNRINVTNTSEVSEYLGFQAWAPDPTYQPIGCGADLNCDGSTNLNDISLWRRIWANPAHPDRASADLDSNGSINIVDYLRLFAAWLEL